MKVKNIMFSGFMAVVLAGVCGAASAAEMTGDALVVASKGYVDTKLGNVNTALSDKIKALEDANKEGGAVANAIAAAQEAADNAQDAADNAQGAVDALAEKMDLTSADSDLSQALAAKENTTNKITTTDATYFTGGKVTEGALTSMATDNTKFPTVAAAVEIADAKAQQVVKDINETAGNLGELKSSVDKLVAGDSTPGSVAYQVKAEADRAKGEEGRIEGLVTAETERAEGVEQGLQSAIDALNGTAEQPGSVAAAVKAEADRAKLAEQANADAITDLTNGAVKDNTDAIAAINNETNGILAQAKEYTNTEMAKFYANAQTCIANSDSKNCIMSAKLDGENNVQYVWISLTSPAE